MADSLLLDDLGYHDYGKIAQIDEQSGWFVNRLKIDSNVPITDEHRRWRGNAISLKGAHLQDVFVLLEAVFKLLNSFVLLGVLLAEKRVLSEKSDIPLVKDRPTHRTDRRVVRPRRSVRPGKRD